MYGQSTGTSGRNIGAGKREACRTEPGCAGPFTGSAWWRWRICLLKLVKNKPKTKGNDSLDDYDYGEEDSEEWETEIEESDEPDADGGSTEEDDEDSVK